MAEDNEVTGDAVYEVPVRFRLSHQPTEQTYRAIEELIERIRPGGVYSMAFNRYALNEYSR